MLTSPLAQPTIAANLPTAGKELPELGEQFLVRPGKFVRGPRPRPSTRRKFVGEPARRDAPQPLEELNERDPGRVREREQVLRSRARARGTGWIEERRHVAGISTHREAETAERAAGARRDLAERITERRVVGCRGRPARWLHLTSV